MKTFLTGGLILTPATRLTDSALEIENGIIQRILRIDEIQLEQDCEIIHTDGYIITPGLIDIHVHGSNRADTMQASYEAFNTMSLFFARHGVTSFLATTVTANEEDIYRTLEAIAAHQDAMQGANLLGAHLEGPFLNINHKGAQAPQHLRIAGRDEYARWFRIGGVKLITIAPELDGSRELIAYGLSNGAEFAIGHSGASYEQVIQAADLGVRQATHTYNGMQGMNHREPGTAGGVLTDDRIYAQIIADGIHVHPAMIKLLVRAKGIERTILITDAIQATGMEDGEYLLGDMQVTVKDSVARIANGSLAGSTLTLDVALRNMMVFTGLDFQDIVRMATIIPAQAMHIADKKGCIQPGADADLTIFDEQHCVAATLVKGKIVFEKENLERS